MQRINRAITITRRGKIWRMKMHRRRSVRTHRVANTHFVPIKPGGKKRVKKLLHPQGQKQEPHMSPKRLHAKDLSQSGGGGRPGVGRGPGPRGWPLDCTALGCPNTGGPGGPSPRQERERFRGDSGGLCVWGCRCKLTGLDFLWVLSGWRAFIRTLGGCCVQGTK